MLVIIDGSVGLDVVEVSMLVLLDAADAAGAGVTIEATRGGNTSRFISEFSFCLFRVTPVRPDDNDNVSFDCLICDSLELLLFAFSS